MASDIGPARGRADTLSDCQRVGGALNPEGERVMRPYKVEAPMQHCYATTSAPLAGTSEM